MKKVFIINPTSGKKDYQKVKDNINKYVLDEHIVLETKKPLDATKLASKYKNEEDTIVYSVGGDGTLNEVINGIAGGKCYLGIIPTGSGNDFYKSLKVYNKKEGKIDLGTINGRYFINIASIGFDAEINYNALQMQKGKAKKSYVKSLIKTLFKYKFKTVKVTIDNKTYDGDYTLIAICNGRYYGGGFKIAPFASFDDDIFDIYLVKKVGKLRVLGILLKMFQSKHENCKEIKKIRSNNILIESDEELLINIDGEISKSKTVNVSMYLDSIRIINDKEFVEKIMN